MNSDLYAEAGWEVASIQAAGEGEMVAIRPYNEITWACTFSLSNDNNDKIRLGRPVVTIATCLSNEYMKCTGNKISNIDQYNTILRKAHDNFKYSRSRLTM